MTSHSQRAAPLRAIAASLLQAALKIAPPGTADWGRAMLGELPYVEGAWSALAWSIGSAGVLAKHALFAALFPGSTNQLPANAGAFFAKEKPMRKSSLIIAAACLAASLLFFAIPTFRQAFRVSLKQWDELHSYETVRRDSDLKIEALAERARQNRDAEGLAFAAIHENDATHSARFAEEAVQLDSRLTWVYASVAVQHPMVADITNWVSSLEAYDPQNAIPHFILVEKIDIDQEVPGRLLIPKDIETPAWNSAMAAAFTSSKFDDYRERVNAIDRVVVLRYKIEDPDLVDTTQWTWLPTYAVGDSAEYADFLVKTGDALEADHNEQGAKQKYLAVATFLPKMNLSPNRHGFIAQPLERAYERLASLSRENGDTAQTEMYGQLAAGIEQKEAQWRATYRQHVEGTPAVRRKAAVVKISGMLIPACAIALLASLAGALIRTRSIHWSELRTRRFSLGVGFSSAVVLVASIFGLYFVYRPYSQILNNYLATGDTAHIGQFIDFLSRAETPFDVPALRPNFSVHFWFAIIVLCAAALIIAGAKFVWRRRKPAMAA